MQLSRNLCWERLKGCRRLIQKSRSKLIIYWTTSEKSSKFNIGTNFIADFGDERIVLQQLLSDNMISSALKFITSSDFLDD